MPRSCHCGMHILFWTYRVGTLLMLHQKYTAALTKVPDAGLHQHESVGVLHR